MQVKGRSRRRRRTSTPLAAAIETCEQRICLSAVFDVDNDGRSLPLTDGIYILRHLAGFRGDSLHEDPQRARRITDKIESIVHRLDVDQDNTIQALTDGILLIRHLAGFNADSLTASATTASGQRTSAAEIERYLTNPLDASTEVETLPFSAIPDIGAGVIADSAKEVVVTIDFFDSAWVHVALDGPAPDANYIHDLTRNLKANGADTIVVRTGVLGLFHYQTDLSYPIGNFDPTHVDPLLAGFERIDGLTGTDIEAYKQQRAAIHSVLQQLNLLGNPLETFVTEGRSAGLKVVLWIDLFDDIYPGYRSKFLEENPHTSWQAADGSKHPGLISYAYEESRDFRVAQVQELLEQTDADGIYLSTSAHSRHFYVDGEPDEYGFEAAVVDEYFSQTGDDLLTTDNIDRDVWNDIKGDFMYRLYQEIDAVTDSFGAELWVGQQLGDITGLTLDGAYTGPLVASYSNRTDSLIQDEIADVLVVNDYEYTSLWGHPNATRYIEGKNINAGPTQEDLFAWAENHFGDPDDTRLIVWAPISTSGLNQEVPFWTDIVTDFQFDGAMLHESINFELGRFESLVTMSQAFSKFVSVGRLNHGIAAGDFEQGTGFIMHSNENVHLRFDADPVQPGNSDHLVAVRYTDGQWFYNNNRHWIAFTPQPADRLIASIDFSANSITGLEGDHGPINGINRGYVSSDLTFFANQWAGQLNDGEFQVTGTFFQTL